MLFLHLLDRMNSSAKISELGKFLLDFLQPLVPLAVSDLRLCVVSAFTSILPVQLLKLPNLSAETTDLFPKDFEVIHVSRIPAVRTSVANPFARGTPHTSSHLPVRQSHTGLPLSSRNKSVSVPFTSCRARITSEVSCFTFDPVTATRSPLVKLRPISS